MITLNHQIMKVLGRLLKSSVKFKIKNYRLEVKLGFFIIGYSVWFSNGIKICSMFFENCLEYNFKFII